MANTRSAEKRNRQAQKRRARNIKIRSGLKSSVKKARETLEKGEPAEVATAVKAATRSLDRSASKGIIHKNAASRRISRLAKAAAKRTAAAK